MPLEKSWMVIWKATQRQVKVRDSPIQRPPKRLKPKSEWVDLDSDYSQVACQKKSLITSGFQNTRART